MFDDQDELVVRSSSRVSKNRGLYDKDDASEKSVEPNPTFRSLYEKSRLVKTHMDHDD